MLTILMHPIVKQLCLLGLPFLLFQTTAAAPKFWSEMSRQEQEAAANGNQGRFSPSVYDTFSKKHYGVGDPLFQYDAYERKGAYVRITAIQTFPDLRAPTMQFVPYALQLTPIDEAGRSQWH